MACVREELQLVAMKAVAIVGEEMKEGDGGSDGEEDCEAGLAGGCGRGLVEGVRRQRRLQTVCFSSLRSGAGDGSVAALAGLRNTDGGHASGSCALDSHVGVFKNEAILRRDVEAGGGGEEGIGSGLGARVILRRG